MPEITNGGDWTIYNYHVVTSTNLVAAHLPAWHAVRADVQTAGRGRFQRTWLSGEGGLWVSAVVPAPTTEMTALPLTAGLAVCETLTRLGVTGLRMRWPNDVLLHDKKLSGLLVDRFQPGLAIIGVGINVTNQPEAADPLLRGATARLADVLNPPPSLTSLTESLLRNIREVLLQLDRYGFASLAQAINPLWGPAREVELDLDGNACRGTFGGIDEVGRLLLSSGDSGPQKAFAPHQVRHLAEL